MATYKISIYIEGHPGRFEYDVSSLEQAMNHFAAITSAGYRRINSRKQMEWYSPHLLRHIKIEGEGLDMAYCDTFVRT